MSEPVRGGIRSLVVGVGTRVCAVPLIHVAETMRPLPVEPISGAPAFVRGISIIRGVPTPVVDLGLVLGAPGGVAGRFVTLRLGDRQVALSVETVLGVRDLDRSTIQELPPLLQEASNDFIEAIGTLDSRMLVVMRAAWELPDEVWQSLTAQEATA
jgi:purine-binding chemotaxis protein CheW